MFRVSSSLEDGRNSGVEGERVPVLREEPGGVLGPTEGWTADGGKPPRPLPGPGRSASDAPPRAQSRGPCVSATQGAEFTREVLQASALLGPSARVGWRPLQPSFFRGLAGGLPGLRVARRHV